MDVKIFVDKSVNENAAYYYELSKDAKKKIKGAEKAIEETKKEMEKTRKKKKEKAVRVKKEKKWFEKFHWFYTSEGKLAVGGKNAQQNDIVFKKYMEDNDLFFHADIQGGSAVILKEGTAANEEEILESAQFAASFSNAWRNGNAGVDVYSVKKEQVSKHATGGFIPVGSFAISGERNWYRNTKLGLKIGWGEQNIEILPERCERKLKNEIYLVPAKSGKDKGEIGRMIAKKLSVDATEILELIPSGKSKIVKR